MIKVPTGLQIEPVPRGDIKILRQAQGRAGRYIASSIHKLIDTLVGYVDGVAQLALGDSSWNQESLQQHLGDSGRTAKVAVDLKDAAVPVGVVASENERRGTPEPASCRSAAGFRQPYEQPGILVGQRIHLAL